MVKLSDVRINYGREQVLDGIDLEIARGEFVAVVGPSGSGKSTMLNTIAGLLTVAGGEVEVEGVSLYDLDVEKRTVFRRHNFGFVFQTFNLIPYLTALENVQVPLYLAGFAAADQQARALAVLDRVGLKRKAHRLPSQLSVGEQQRVAIARALVNEPKVLLADEPTGNLDRRTGQEIRDLILPLGGDGLTVIWVTHDPEMAALAPRTITIVDGRLTT